MRYFFRRRLPKLERVLLVESGARNLLDTIIPSLIKDFGKQIEFDLVTCYAGQPPALPEGSRIYRVGDYQGTPARARLYAELAARRHTHIGIVCSAQPIMTKWKWVLAFRIHGKLFVINENADYFWVDWGNWKAIRGFVLFRAGLSGAGAVSTLARLVLFPFTLAYLLLYAATVHLRRAFRS